VRSEKYAVMMTTSKSMAPIARRKNPKDGSGITALPFLLAFAIDSELQAGRFSSKPAALEKSKSWECFPMLGDRASAHREQMFEVASCHTTIHMDPKQKRRRPCQFFYGF
jgi:hypothetical protein